MCGWSDPHSSYDCKTQFSNNRQGMLERQGLLLTGVGECMHEVVGREGEKLFDLGFCLYWVEGGMSGVLRVYSLLVKLKLKSGN